MDVLVAASVDVHGLPLIIALIFHASAAMDCSHFQLASTFLSMLSFPLLLLLQRKKQNGQSYMYMAREGQ